MVALRVSDLDVVRPWRPPAWRAPARAGTSRVFSSSLSSVERRLAHRRVNVGALVDAELDLARLELLAPPWRRRRSRCRSSDSASARADRARAPACRPRPSGPGVATIASTSSQPSWIFFTYSSDAHEVGARRLRLLLLLAPGTAPARAGSCRSRAAAPRCRAPADRSAAGSTPEVGRDDDGLVELGAGGLLDQLHRPRPGC